MDTDHCNRPPVIAMSRVSRSSVRFEEWDKQPRCMEAGQWTGLCGGGWVTPWVGFNAGGASRCYYRAWLSIPCVGVVDVGERRRTYSTYAIRLYISLSFFVQGKVKVSANVRSILMRRTWDSAPESNFSRTRVACKFCIVSFVFAFLLWDRLRSFSFHATFGWIQGAKPTTRCPCTEKRRPCVLCLMFERFLFITRTQFYVCIRFT